MQHETDSPPDDLSHEHDCELVIGLVAAVGTELDRVTAPLIQQLELAGYEHETIRISEDVIPLLVETNESWDSKFERISELMTAGNEARGRACNRKQAISRNGDAVLAYGAAAHIFARREEDPDGNSKPNGKKAYIIRSLKRPEEIEALRFIYPQGFVLVGVHAEEERRRAHLQDDLGMTAEESSDLIRRDGEESKVTHGQRVNRSFHLADFFLHADGNGDQLKADIRRMVELWFGCPFHTPTFDEFAMYLAFSAALRSADLSRQVGAVLAKNKQVLATGANECPRAGGGLYWPERQSDGTITDAESGRDYMRGVDSNRKEQLRLIEAIVDRVKAAGTFEEDKLRGLLDETSGISDLTEYGRVVHAEMAALLACAQTAVSTDDADLYCTTFPCHNCAKHIVASGVKRVVYIEPYAKSKALDLHDDSIATGIGCEGGGQVAFEPFVGIGPRRFFDLFSMKLGTGYDLERKDSGTGKRQDWNISAARLRIQMKPVSYLDLEKVASGRFSAFASGNSDKEENDEQG